MLKNPSKKCPLIFGIFFVSQICGALAANDGDDWREDRRYYQKEKIEAWQPNTRHHISAVEGKREKRGNRADLSAMTAKFDHFSLEEGKTQERILSLPPTTARIHAKFPTKIITPTLSLSTPPTKIKLLFPASNQGDLGTCASFSTVECLQVVHLRALSQACLVTTAEKYDNCRNDGVQLGLAMAVAKIIGVVRYEAWPYDVYQKAVIATTPTVSASTNLCVIPPVGIDREPRFGFIDIESLFATARAGCVADRPCVINKVQLICAALDKYKAPVSISVPVRRDDWATGIITTFSGKEDGWHAITVYGYDPAKQVFNFRNSWGPEWGYKGSGVMSYDYVAKRSSEAWIGYGAAILPKPIVPTEVTRPTSAVGTMRAYESKTEITTAPTPRTVVKYSRENLQSFLHYLSDTYSDTDIAKKIDMYSGRTIGRLRIDENHAKDSDYSDVWMALKVNFGVMYKHWRNDTF